MLDKAVKPSSIVAYLDQFVIGQENAKKILAVAVYSHYRKIEQASEDSVEIAKSNVLLIGPSGTGKTLMCETLSKFLNVPFVTADATSLAQTRYVNEEIEGILQRLVDKADGDVASAERGIVFIDEIDKLKAPQGQPRSISGESVQHALLKIMEGSPAKLASSQYIDTSNILFICGGAFVGLDEIMAKTRAYGFISTSQDDNKNILDRLNTRVKPTDLFEFGLIPEFTGRLPIVASFHDLTRPMLVQILTEPRNSIYNQFREIFRLEGVELSIERKVFEQISEIAFEYKTGARSLRGIFEELITPILYVVPDQPDVRKVEIASLFAEPSFLRSPTSQVTVMPQASPAVISDLAPTGRMRVGLNMSNFLLTRTDAATGAPAGVAPDLAQELGRRLGVPVELIPYPNPGALADAAKSNVWDVGFLGAEPQRAEEIDFTAAYVEIEATYLVQPGSSLKSVADVDREGVRIAISEKSAYDLYLSRNLKHAKLVREKGADNVFKRFVDDKLDAIAGLRPRLVTDHDNLPGSRILDGRFTAVQQAAGTPKGRSAGAQYLREFIEDVKATGLVARTIEKNNVRGLTVAAKA